MENIGKVVLILLSIPLAWLSWAFAFTKMWLWFIMEPFNMEPLSYHTAIGFSCIVSLFLYPIAKSHELMKNKDDSIFMPMVSSLLTPMLLLGFAWIAHILFS